MAKCALCQQEKSLCNSHILPEFLYGSMYDEKHCIFTFSSYDRGKEKPEQKGIREPLLCKDCETLRSKWERYASDVILGRSSVEQEVKDGYVRMSGIDYTPFKLFLMSNLWMSGVASHDLFAEVQLGDRHHERLRGMLLSEDPGEPWDYPCTVQALLDDGELRTEWIIKPVRGRLEGQRCYQFVYGGCLWIQVAASHKLRHEYGLICLGRHGGMSVKLSAVQEHPGLMELFIDLTKRYDRDGNLLPT